MNSGPESMNIDPNVFSLFDGVALIATIAALVLAIVAIWLSVSFKRDADKVNKSTIELLIEIRSDAKAISQGVMDELHAYGSAMRGVFTQNTTTDPGGVSGTPEDFTIDPSGSGPDQN